MTHEDEGIPIGKVVGQAVKRARRGQDEMTQEEFASYLRAGGLDWSRNTVANLESGRMVKIDVGALLVIAKTLELSPVDLLAPEGEYAIRFSDSLWYPASAVRPWIRGANPGLLTNASLGPASANEDLALSAMREATRHGSDLVKVDLIFQLLRDGEIKRRRAEAAGQVWDDARGWVDPPTEVTASENEGERDGLQYKLQSALQAHQEIVDRAKREGAPTERLLELAEQALESVTNLWRSSEAGRRGDH